MLLALALVAGCVSEQPSATPGTAKIRIAIQPAASAIPIHVAETRGIFERNGLRIQRTEGTDLPGFAVALDQDQYDIVLSVPTIILVAANRGLDVLIVSRLSKSSAAQPGTVWITKDHQITSIDQLRGKTIAVPALTGQIIDSLVYLLQRSGIPRDQVKFVQIPFAAMADQLKAGRVDVAVAPAPFSTSMVAQGFQAHEDVVVEAVRTASDGAVDNGMTAVCASTASFARDHPEVLRAWRRSLQEAIDHLNTNEAEVRALMQSWLKMPPEVARSSPLPAWELDIAPADLRPYVTIAKSVGTIDREPDVATLVWQDHP